MQNPDNLQIPQIAWVEYGGFLRRLGANLIDGLIFLPLGLVTLFLTLKVNLWLYFPLQILNGVLSAANTTSLHALFGATVGKMATGLSVRKLDLNHIGWTEAVGRSSVDYAFLITIAIGNILVFLAVPKKISITCLSSKLVNSCRNMSIHYFPFSKYFLFSGIGVKSLRCCLTRRNELFTISLRDGCCSQKIPSDRRPRQTISNDRVISAHARVCLERTRLHTNSPFFRIFKPIIFQGS